MKNNTAVSWAHALDCALAQPYALYSLHDHSAPVNAALLLLKPSEALFAEGVRVLQLPTPFNRTHGWELVGPLSSSTVDKSDPVWEARRRGEGLKPASPPAAKFFIYTPGLHGMQMQAPLAEHSTSRWFPSTRSAIRLTM